MFTGTVVRAGFAAVRSKPTRGAPVAGNCGGMAWYESREPAARGGAPPTSKGCRTLETKELEAPVASFHSSSKYCLSGKY